MNSKGSAGTSTSGERLLHRPCDCSHLQEDVKGREGLPPYEEFNGQLRPRKRSSTEESKSLLTSVASSRYLHCAGRLMDRVVPGKLASKYLPKLDNATAVQVCYRFLGCFSTGDNLTHPYSLPGHPESVNTKLLLYSRSNRDSPVRLDYRPEKELGPLVQFKLRKPLKFLVHGFLESGRMRWITGLKNALLDEEDCNVIIVDLCGGARKLSYIKASGNTALVGRQASMLLQRLMKKFPDTLGPDQVHVVGFSLGAQIAGFFARHFRLSTGKPIWRVTGLDPAGPLFAKMKVCLCKQDARFIDAIHTSRGEMLVKGRLGIGEPVGHVNFYPNGGEQQPGCLGIFLPCHHMRAPAYFLESIQNKKCRFVSKSCGGGYAALWMGKCKPGGPPGLMGYYSYTAPGRGVQTLTTNARRDYCKPQS